MPKSDPTRQLRCIEIGGRLYLHSRLGRPAPVLRLGQTNLEQAGVTQPQNHACTEEMAEAGGSQQFRDTKAGKQTG